LRPCGKQASGAGQTGGPGRAGGGRAGEGVGDLAQLPRAARQVLVDSPPHIAIGRGGANGALIEQRRLDESRPRTVKPRPHGRDAAEKRTWSPPSLRVDLCTRVPSRGVEHACVRGDAGDDPSPVAAGCGRRSERDPQWDDPAIGEAAAS
jgi:hypothetical protein